MRVSVLWTALILLAGCGGDEATAPVKENGEAARETVVPADGFLGVWNHAGPCKVFKGANLYGHIDGGAEVFLELGFERLEVQRYGRGGEEEISAEVYWMDDPMAALGIYLMKCGQETPDAAIAARHTANAYQVLLQKGAAYVTLYNLTGEAEPGQALVEFAKHIAGRLPAVETPGPFAYLPAEGRIAGSERIIRGPFTLQRVFTLGKGDILLLEQGVTAVAASYETGPEESFTLILADYPDAAAARAAFRNVRADLDPYLEVVSSDEARLVFKDYAGKYGTAEVKENRLEIRVDLQSAP
jgi:hypothetical protein